MSEFYGQSRIDPETMDALRRASEVNNGVLLFQAIWALYLILQVLALLTTPAICAKIIACARGHNEILWFWVTLACPPAILILLAMGEKKIVLPGRTVRKETTA
jgi:hypothetical protein